MIDHFYDKIDNHLTLGNPDGRPKAEELECPRCNAKVYELIEHDYSIIALVRDNKNTASEKKEFCEDCIQLMPNYFMCKNCKTEFVETGIAKECPGCKCKELWGDNPEMNELIKKVNK
jgi:hypothetical protein